MWNTDQQQVFESLDRNLLISGPGGTGKSLILQDIASRYRNESLVVAPTGIAAIQIDGFTIHKAFRIHELSRVHMVSLKDGNLNYYQHKMSYDYIRASKDIVPSMFQILLELQDSLKDIKYLIIDEISMVSSKMFDTINHILQLIKCNTSPMGGLQVYLFGDFMQLQPIDQYKGQFVFKSEVWSKLNLKYIFLNTIVRQSDPSFILVLNNIRFGIVNNDVLNLFEQLRIESSDNDEYKNWTHLVPTNEGCDIMNCKELQSIDRTGYSYVREPVKDIPFNVLNVNIGLVPVSITLKVGTKVLLIRNGKYLITNTNKYINLCNGHSGVVVRLREHSVDVRINNVVVSITRQLYYYDTYKNDVRQSIPIFHQIPLIYGWAITIHKSQGMTLNNAIVHLDNIKFPGQLYVALSRVKSSKDLRLIYSHLSHKMFNIHTETKRFYGQHQ